jgi:hypothetical protein
MINPTTITNFNRTERELQEFWLFCIMVAGKNSSQTANKLNRALEDFDGLPFDTFATLGEPGIRGWLEQHKIGQYDRITGAIVSSLVLDLSNVELETLLKIKGVGQKTSRFFLCHSRKDFLGAVLDTHILKWLAVYNDGVPKQTPQNRKIYGVWENIFVQLSQRFFPNQSIADADLAIWKSFSQRQ